MNCLHIYTGDVKGKTTSAVGLALRMLGYDKKVVFCQFFKAGTSGEIKALQSFENLTYLNTEKKYPFAYKMTQEQKVDATNDYSELFCQAASMAEEYDMIVFDEIISTCNLGFLDKEYVIATLKKIKKYCEVITTGRDPFNELYEIADYISNIQSMKHPYDDGLEARQGIEY